MNDDKRAVMASAKKAVLDLVKKLPEDCTLEDIQYQLYVLQKIEKGLKDADEGRVISQEEMEQRFAKWLAPCRACGYRAPSSRSMTIWSSLS
jgi:predicted transcriptional regulator